MIIPALTICQPYAELIAAGAKPVENRRWATSRRQVIAIHAGSGRDHLPDGDDGKSYVYGAVVALAVLVDCFKPEEISTNWPNLHPDIALNPHVEGPWCFRLDRVYRLPRPLAAKGAQMFWRWDCPDEVRGAYLQAYPDAAERFVAWNPRHPEEVAA